MGEQKVTTRIVNKHDTETNWLKATNFIPKQGEFIIYDIDETHDYERLKIGDGATVVSSLPFAHVQSDWNATEGDALILNKPPVTTEVNTVSVGDDSTLNVTLSGSRVFASVEHNLNGVRIYQKDHTTKGSFYIRPGSSGNAIDVRNDNGELKLVSGTSDGPDVSVIGVAEPTANNGVASKLYVDNKVASLVDSAPDTLDTLNELAEALGNDPNFATTVATQIGSKVDKVDGKGLSTNDFTTNEKNKLAGIDIGANKTVVDSALSDTSTNPVQNKVIKETIDSLSMVAEDENLDGNIVMRSYIPGESSGPVVDDSLSIRGAAADAKAVGDLLVNIPSVDNTLTQEGFAADAKVVGDWMNNIVLSENNYGAAYPETVREGQLFLMEDTTAPLTINDVKSIFLSMYPVGSIYMSVNSASPSTFMGGTWAQIKDTFLLAAGNSYSAGSTGGSATQTLTTANLPAHTHDRGTMNITGSMRLNWSDGTSGIITSSSGYSGAFSGSHIGTSYYPSTVKSSTSTNHLNYLNLDASKGWSGSTSSVGSGTAHNNMPPYLAVYVWKRTA